MFVIWNFTCSIWDRPLWGETKAWSSGPGFFTAFKTRLYGPGCFACSKDVHVSWYVLFVNKTGKIKFYSSFQNNVSYWPPDNFNKIGKNSSRFQRDRPYINLNWAIFDSICTDLLYIMASRKSSTYPWVCLLKIPSLFRGVFANPYASRSQHISTPKYRST